jgi:hypothetical protein
MQKKVKNKNFSGHGTRVRASPAELRLLVRILAKDAAGAARCLEGCPNLMNMLADTCNRSGLSVVLLRALEGSHLRSAVMPHQIELLNEALQVQKERLQAIRPALADIAELFKSSRQPFMLLKGAYLAGRFYGDILGREFVDIDLLVPARDRSKASALLETAGFQRYSGILLHEDLTRFFVHAFDFRSGNVSVDLHWDLSRHISLHLDEEQLWTQHNSFIIDGRSYDVLSDPHEVIFAALSLLRDIERGHPKPKNVVDIIQIAATADARMDWDNLLSARDGTAGPLAYVLPLCLEITAAFDLVPNLTDALNRHRRIRVPDLTSAADSPLQFRPAFLGLGNKLWAARAYDTNLAAWLLWWALSLPFRLAVHKQPPPQSRHRNRSCA